jgi:23S rRNA (adenine2503-C2)-methyltransferase
MRKKCIKDLSLQEIEDYFAAHNEKQYRAGQLCNWLYERNVASFTEMTNFSKLLRAQLADTFELSALSLEDRQISKVDGTEKYLFRTHDNHYIEAVLIKREKHDDGKLTICLSTQVGCAMGCVFCQTAKIGFIRNLETGEIIDQVCHIRRISGLKNNNIVFMGMGEPFMNYEKMIKAAHIMNYSFGFHLSVRKITISTCGVLPMIERYIDEKQPFNLAISVNDTDPVKRGQHMPVEKKYPLNRIAEMLEKKFPVSRNRLTLEYVMRKDNISRKNALHLKKMFRFSRIKLNAIKLNPGKHSIDIPTDKEIDEFIEALQVMNVPITIRKSLGQDIDGACGQLSGRKYLQ